MRPVIIPKAAPPMNRKGNKKMTTPKKAATRPEVTETARKSNGSVGELIASAALADRAATKKDITVPTQSDSNKDKTTVEGVVMENNTVIEVESEEPVVVKVTFKDRVNKLKNNKKRYIAVGVNVGVSVLSGIAGAVVLGLLARRQEERAYNEDVRANEENEHENSKSA